MNIKFVKYKVCNIKIYFDHKLSKKRKMVKKCLDFFQEKNPFDTNDNFFSVGTGSSNKRDNFLSFQGY